jgi:hypothetical protein
MVTIQQRILWVGRVLLALVLLTAAAVPGGAVTFRIAVGIDPDRLRWEEALEYKYAPQARA